MNRSLLSSLALSRLPKRVVAYIVLTTFFGLYLLTAGASIASAAETDTSLTTGAVQLRAKAAILLDAATGQVLYQFNADEARPPASMAKVMTEYLVNKAVKEGKLSWDQEIIIQDNAAKQDRRGSIILLNTGDKHTVRQLYQAMAIFSANDAAVQLAETISGSEANFVELMNETAKQLGMNNTHYVNATGLELYMMPEAYRPATGETLMSARDTATLAYTIIKEFPEVLNTSKIPSLKFRERDKTPMINWNWMLEANKANANFRKFAYTGVDGLKTGNTDSAGKCFVGTSLINGTRLISVVMGVPGTTEQGYRFIETAKLFDYGFNGFEKQTLLEAKITVPGYETLKVKKGKSKSVAVVTATDLTLLVPKNSKTVPELLEAKSVQDPLVAPIKTGDKVGTATYKYKDPSTMEEKTVSIDLLASEDVNKASWWRMLLRTIGDFFRSLFNGIVNLF